MPPVARSRMGVMPGPVAVFETYIPEPWIFFQLASMACTALGGSGT